MGQSAEYVRPGPAPTEEWKKGAEKFWRAAKRSNMPSVERELNHSDDARKTNNNHVYFVKRKATAPYLLKINFNN